MLKEAFEEVLVELARAAQAVYQDRLITVAVYGSVGRGTMRHDSDVDVLTIGARSSTRTTPARQAIRSGRGGVTTGPSKAPRSRGGD